MPARGQQNGKYQGSKWISRERRLAIYMRDGLSCCYCGHSLEDGAFLTLDHVHAQANGGTNKSENLITACRQCNGSKGSRSVENFVVAVAEYLNHSIKPEEILAHIQSCLDRPVNVKVAKAMIASRGSYSAALNGK